jgi:hypothetical protein
MSGGYLISGDDTYACIEYLLAPYSKQNLLGHHERDDYNFYQSRCWVNVECGFGIIVSRF